MGVFSRPFDGGKKKGPDEDIQALRAFLDEIIPEEYRNSPQYSVTITREKGLFSRYTACVTLDMTADGSDYSGCPREELEDLAAVENLYLGCGWPRKPPVPVDIFMDMYFDETTHVMVRDGEVCSEYNGPA